jgi:hypothetical protein
MKSKAQKAIETADTRRLQQANAKLSETNSRLATRIEMLEAQNRELKEAMQKHVKESGFKTATQEAFGKADGKNFEGRIGKRWLNTLVMALGPAKEYCTVQFNDAGDAVHFEPDSKRGAKKS